MAEAFRGLPRYLYANGIRKEIFSFELHGRFILLIYYLRRHCRSQLLRSNTGIVSSNPIQDMDVCLRLFCICVALCRYGLIARPRSLTNYQKIKKRY
jgi:hypothetical protein